MKIKCDICNKIHRINVEWQETSSHERQMGPEIFYYFGESFDCECDTKINIELEGSEYPYGDEVRIHSVHIKNASII